MASHTLLLTQGGRIPITITLRQDIDTTQENYLNGPHRPNGTIGPMPQSVAVSAAKQQLGSLVDRAHLAHETVFLTKHGRKMAALVDADEYESLLEHLEDLEDAIAATAARQEIADGEASPIPWNEVKADLGLA